MKLSSFQRNLHLLQEKASRDDYFHSTAVVGNCIKISVYHVGTRVSDTQPVV